MRSKLITCFCIIWAVSLLAPSIITLVDEEAIGVIIPLTEEEHKDAKPELQQTYINEAKGLTFFLQFEDLVQETPFYSDLGSPKTDREIILPPPKRRLA